MNKKILIIAAHADDEVLGCGGTIARHIAEGDVVTVVFMTDGITARALNEQNSITERKTSSVLAMEALGVNDIRQYSFPDNKMDSVPLLDVTKCVESVISKIKPEIVYTHFANDLNIDHRVTHQAVLTACRPQKGSSVKTILSFEVLSSTEWNTSTIQGFQPQYIVDITPYWEKKYKALRCYDQEMRDFPHSRSYKAVEAMAILRGAMFGCEMAECFYIERIIERL